MRDSDWDIRRDGRAWDSDEFDQRLDLRPEKLEIWEGKLLWSDEERVELLGLLLENLGTDHAVRMGDIGIWRDAIATRWLREVNAKVKSDMEDLRVEVEIGSPITGARRVVDSVLVNPDATLSWMPADVLEELAIERRKVWQFLRADGSIVERPTGSVIVRAAGVETFDLVVFGEPGDPVVLGARSLGGLNLRIDPLNRLLVDAGPAAAAAV